MQFRNFFFWTRSLFCLLLFFSLQSTYAQKLTTNETGEKIVIFEDGSWRYFDAEKDAHLEVAAPSSRPVAESREEVDFPLNAPTKPKKKGKVAKTKKVKKKKAKAKKVKSAKAKKGKVKKPKKAKKKKAKKNKSPKKEKKAKKQKKGKAKKGKKKINKPEKMTKVEVDPAEIERSDQMAVRRAERAVAEAGKKQRVLEDFALERVFLEEELQEAYTNMEITDNDIAQIEGRLRTAREKEETAMANYTEAIDLANEYERMINMSYHKREKALAKMNASQATADPSLNMGAGVDTGMVDGASGSQLSKAEQKQADEVKSRRQKMDVMVFPPQSPCHVVFDGLDEFTGKMRRDLGKQPFFNFTNKKMRPFLKGKDFISCSGGLSSFSSGIYVLSLDLEVATPNAQRDYGYIEKGSVLTIKFIDGSTTRLYNRKTDMGTLNPLEKSVIYKPTYAISSALAKTIRKGEVDKVRMVWSTGYEDYEVFELDFFINQFRCLEEN